MARRVHLEEIDKSSNDLQGALEASVVTINFEAEAASEKLLSAAKFGTLDKLTRAI